jgi:hypothetical protein
LNDMVACFHEDFARIYSWSLENSSDLNSGLFSEIPLLFLIFL